MIVMKFGGSSLACVASIGRVVSIIESEAGHKPVVVASAMGDTTDQLLEILDHSRTANTYAALKLQNEVKRQHFSVCEELLTSERQSATEEFLRHTFRDLHVQMLELAEGERRFTPALQDWTTSLGEQLSSRILAAVLEERLGAAVHMDARKLILTDSTFTNAEPLYWETYARIRRAMPASVREKVVVLAGFIASAEDGRTTTMGRGGSDLTASIVGAALNAEEIQVWKDVDGMLTCDPRIWKSGHQVKRLTYEEATELARAGATILHPETMAPARRLRIPIVIRNTFRPACTGTRIEHRSVAHVPAAKSIAVRNRVTLLEIKSRNSTEDARALQQFCARSGFAASVVWSAPNAVYVAIDETSPANDAGVENLHYMEVHVRSRQAILTIVGSGLQHKRTIEQLSEALYGVPHFLIPGDGLGVCLRVAVPNEEVTRALRQLHQAFFSHPDPTVFAATAAVATEELETAPQPLSSAGKEIRGFVIQLSLLQVN